MGKFHIYTQSLKENALFSGKFYTVGNIFTRPPVVTVATNFKSECVRDEEEDLSMNKRNSRRPRKSVLWKS